MLTNTFLSKEIEETLVTNPEVPITSLKDQLRKKYNLGVSKDKIYRAKEKASLKVNEFIESNMHI